MPSGNRRATKSEQKDRFEQAARELGCDEDESHFDDKLKKVARHKPRDEAPSSIPRSEASKERK